MGEFIYNISLFFYNVIINIAAPFNKKARLFVEGRKDLLQRIETALAESKAPIAWFHCASLGEFEQGRPLIDTFKEEYPHYEIFLTFFSPSGYEVRKNYAGADYIFYLPTDSKVHAKKFLDLINPKIAIFVKYEFWHHYAKELLQRNIPLLSTSSIFRENQLFFKKYGSFYRGILKNFTYFFVQDSKSLKLLESIDITNTAISGDTRFDRVMTICKNKKELPEVAGFKNEKKVMVIGSCWPEDLDVLIPFINDTNLKYIIAPHEIEEKFIGRIERDLIKKVVRYSEIKGFNDSSSFDVLLIDNIGMLSSLYAYGDYAYVGGAYGQGLHNILEPATFGIPIFFGNKNYTKFREAVDLTNLGGAVALAGYDELRTQFRAFSDETTYNIGSQINTSYVKDNTGATKKIIDYCKTIIK
ncbi:3-deoxy-D-manno-octulosonic acid transferase [Fulvivirga sp. 29W222]|uniref:3-deoxy-D-manno-octulosonic acid transferase n=1 Tax=Fulvivirga marina TaxID=2494733 RepID=A0A937FZA3_9BACT|nr:glycosyltransferase N-terminal domain-containing protein [Fulvivirga marina]MBL6447231.1 3-deoxy-D-manno-octulosonic acid transferase [Fulvivirga marina]